MNVNETWWIGTPGYGDIEYSSNLDCTWSVTAPQNSFIVATFETFNLEEGCYDRFNIEGRENQCKTFELFMYFNVGQILQLKSEMRDLKTMI